ncbi:MAG TPA: protein translocase subunit SecF, partial [Acidimicrobiales bacterium]|nr:protein translocase subunit SecF [Acidimicrobiales bacterium]
MSTTDDTSTEAPDRPRAGLFKRLYRGETKFDFVRRQRWWYLFSGLVILAGLISLSTRGLDYSIEFVGGTGWTVQSSTMTVQQAKDAITPFGLGGATIETLASGSKRTIEVEAKLGNGGNTSTDQATSIANALAKAAGVPSSKVTFEQVGPSWGGNITHKAIEALIVFFVLIAAYISFFFEPKMAFSAIIAVIHDVIVTVGIYSLFGLKVTPDTVVAFLTILGYSLYDTIGVFDRVRDNVRGLGATGKMSYTDVVNLSMNQTLARSINTSLVAIMPILSVLVLGANLLGAVTLEYFGLALFVGLTSGAYSSIFIASPLLATIKEREPRYVSIREKLESRGTRQLLLTPAAVAAGALSTDDGPKVRSRRTSAGGGGGGRGKAGQRPPRPGARQQPARPKAGALVPGGPSQRVSEDDEPDELDDDLTPVDEGADDWADVDDDAVDDDEDDETASAAPAAA